MDKNNMFIKQDKKILLYILVAVLLLSLIGGTYAFWRWQSPENEDTNVVLTVTESYSCSADGGGNINNHQRIIAPTTCNNSTYAIKKVINTSVTNNGNRSIYLDLWLDVDALDTGLKNSQYFKYAVTKNSDSCTDDLVASGTFQNKNVGDKINIVEGAEYSGTANDTYYLYIWLDKNETSVATQDQDFALSLNGTCTDNIVIPDIYQKVEYIESDGNQSIVFPNIAKNYIIYDDVQFNSSSKRQLLSLSSGNTGAGQYWGSSEANTYDVGPNSTNRINLTTLNRSVVKITHNGSKIRLEVNGYSVERDGSISTYKYDMFGTGNFKASLKRYGMKVYDTNGILKANMIPCYRKEGGAIGLYDTVGKTFYTNTGSGTFTRGNNIN